MNDFLKMDIFFAVTTVVVIVLGILTAFVLWKVYRILDYAERISKTAAEEAEKLKGDMDELRANVKREGIRLRHFAGFFSRFAGRKRSSSSRKSHEQ